MTSRQQIAMFSISEVSRESGLSPTMIRLYMYGMVKAPEYTKKINNALETLKNKH